MRWNTIWGLVLLGLFVLTGQAFGAGAQLTAATPEPDPLVIARQMCDYLKSLKQFSFRAEVLDDEVYYGGKKL